MKKAEPKLKYLLTSGQEELLRTNSIQAIAKHVNCSFTWIYANRNKNINKDGSWSFNTNGYNYTITKF